MHENVEKLIPELSEWNNGTGINLSSWLGCVGRYDHAIAYAALFWPDFCLHDGCVFLDAPDLGNYDQWMHHSGGNRTSVERVMNHRHIVDVFRNSDFAPTKDIVLHVGWLLKEMWSTKLKRDFPDRPIKVEFYGTDSDDLLACQITVYQER